MQKSIKDYSWTINENIYSGTVFIFELPFSQTLFENERTRISQFTRSSYS